MNLISVVIPAYNSEMHLGLCLDSVIAQREIEPEIIVINDGSVDSTSNVAKSYQSKYKNIKVIDKENEGQGVARNLGVELSTGKYVIFVDSDDTIDSSLCIDMIREMDLSGADFANFGFVFMSVEGKVLKTSTRYNQFLMVQPDISRNCMLENQIYTPPWNKIYRRDFLKSFNIKYPKIRAYEDAYFVRKVAFSASKTVFVNKVYYFANMTVGSTSRRISLDHFKQARELIRLENNELFLDNSNLDHRLVQMHVIKSFNGLLLQAIFQGHELKQIMSYKKIAISSGYIVNFRTIMRYIGKYPVHSLVAILMSFPSVLCFISRIINKSRIIKNPYYHEAK